MEREGKGRKGRKVMDRKIWKQQERNGKVRKEKRITDALCD
jgi:hypothetical protein